MSDTALHTKTPAARPDDAPRTFGDHMRLWRRIRGVSQLQLAVRADVSSRHISFLESGRANPSRQMIETLSDTLDVPLRARNGLLLAAGFAPSYQETPLEAPDASYLRHVLGIMLKGHEPFPAMVLDRHWNVLMTNKAGKLMVGENFENGTSLFDLIFKDGPSKDAIVNWDEVVAATLKRVRREADHMGDPSLYERVERMLPEGWRPPATAPKPGQPREGAVPLIIPVHMRFGDTDLRFVSAIASLGTPADIGVQELTIETFLPADEATEATLRALAG